MTGIPHAPSSESMRTCISFPSRIYVLSRHISTYSYSPHTNTHTHACAYSGWEQRHDQKSNRTYYANSATKTTQWTDPRPSIRPGLRRTKSSEKGVLTHTRAKGHDSDKEWFLDLLKIAMVDKKLTADEMYLLQNAKAKLNISESEYRDLVEEAGWTMGDIAEAKTNGGRDLFSKECCICLDGPATYIILDCMHMCLCEECATVQAKGLKNCPECRATVKAIKKTY